LRAAERVIRKWTQEGVERAARPYCGPTNHLTQQTPYAAKLRTASACRCPSTNHLRDRDSMRPARTPPSHAAPTLAHVSEANVGAHHLINDETARQSAATRAANAAPPQPKSVCCGICAQAHGISET